MDKDQEQYEKELKEAGIDLPELQPKPEATEDEPKDEPTETPEEKSKEEPEGKAPITTTPEEPQQRKRSIYDDLKDAKHDRKEAEKRAEQLEREVAELRAKINDAGDAPEADAPDAKDDAISYAKKVGADPALVERIIKEARANQQAVDPNLMSRLERFEAWEKNNSKAIEQQMFNDEFEKTIPELKNIFPRITDDELKAVRKELDTLSHTKEWHDKSLDYIAFKHRDKLSALVSPKKHGLESKSRKDAEALEFDFDPSADLSTMSPAQQKQWEEQYRQLGKNEGLAVDSQGRKILL